MNETVAKNASSYWTPARMVIWGLRRRWPCFCGRDWVDACYPKEGYSFDFLQEWLSARNWRTRRPVYSPQLETYTFHTGYKPIRDEDMLPWNAHPPAAVLLTLPFASLDYPEAHFVWNLFMVPLFLASVAIAFRELKIPFHWTGLLPAIALTAFCFPLKSNFVQGQLNIVLLILIIAAWSANRRDRQLLAGCFIGVAAAVKLYPAFLFLFWIGGGRRRGLVSGIRRVLSHQSRLPCAFRR